jgi:hypothetical protein
MRNFLKYESEIRAAARYCAVPLEERPELADARAAIAAVQAKLGNLKEYIDSGVKLKTELIGDTQAPYAERGTIAAMIREYSLVYRQTHDLTTGKTEAAKSHIQDLMHGQTAATLAALDKVQALQPAVSPVLAAELTELRNGIFECKASSRSAVENSLRSGPVHDECGLTFAKAEMVARHAEDASREAEGILEAALSQKTKVFCNSGVRELLEQGRHEPLIAALLDCPTDNLQKHFISVLPGAPELVELINKYMKRIRVKRVKLADFRPQNGTIRKEEIGTVVREFGKFLETQFDAEPGDDKTLPVLQLE